MAAGSKQGKRPDALMAFVFSEVRMRARGKRKKKDGNTIGSGNVVKVTTTGSRVAWSGYFTECCKKGGKLTERGA